MASLSGCATILPTSAIPGAKAGRASGRTAGGVPERRSHTVAIVVYDGIAMFEFAVACEIFGAGHVAPLPTPWYRFLVCAVGDSVTMDNGLRMDVPHGLGHLRRADTVLVPPCDSPDGPPAELVRAPATRACPRRPPRLAVHGRVRVGSGRAARRTAGHHALVRVRRPGPSLSALSVDPGVLYVDDGDILTSAGSAAGIDLCLHVVRHDYGAEVAARVARELVVPPYRDGGQAQYIQTPVPDLPTSDLFVDTMAWMQEHLDEPVSVADLAAALR